MPAIHQSLWWLKRDGVRFAVASFVFAGALGVFISIGRTMLASRPAATQQAAQAPTGGDDDIYTGSILLMPSRGDDCWQRFLDNTTGRVWDSGTVSCDAAMAQGASGRSAPSPRLEAISKGFRGQ